MGFADQYLSKQKIYSSHLADVPDSLLNAIVVIPCYNEVGIVQSLESLYSCKRCDCVMEVIVVINASEKDSEAIHEQNQLSLQQVKGWIATHQDKILKFHVLYLPSLPPRHAGVGLARKIGMDEAVYRFNAINNSAGIIVSFDADALCSDNYFQEITKTFQQDEKLNGCSVFFEHPLKGKQFPAEIYEGIAKYELHLRYFNQFLRFIKFPFAYQTLGSSFAVRALPYIRQGGMNLRQAGEDFYFLHKIIPLGNYTEINSAVVYPSPRISNRVPFGTGAAIKKFIDQGSNEYMTYNPLAFVDLKSFFETIISQAAYIVETRKVDASGLSDLIKDYLAVIDFNEAIAEISRNTSSSSSFIKRFYCYFNAFRIIKFLNSTKNNYPAITIEEAACDLLSKMNITNLERNALGLLITYRSLEKQRVYGSSF
jgi:hypothetical protein